MEDNNKNDATEAEIKHIKFKCPKCGMNTLVAVDRVKKHSIVSGIVAVPCEGEIVYDAKRSTVIQDVTEKPLRYECLYCHRKFRSLKDAIVNSL